MKMKFHMHRVASLLLALLLTACQSHGIAPAASPAKSTGQLLFEEKCQTVAGEKIYRKVEDVEGVLLLKVRPNRGDRELADPMWPGAAFAREAREDEFITTFLGYEHSSSPQEEPVTPNHRGYIGPTYQPRNPSNLPGYRYVDVMDEKDGKRYRYTGRWEEPWQYDKSYLKGYIKFFLDKTPATSPAPRYGVTYEDHVVPEERELGVASSTVKVIDLQTQEVLGEMTRYAWGATKPSRTNPSPWLTAWRCPDHAVGTSAATRKFVDQILIPRKEK
ncbi:MAG TPA: hypothetical protein VFW68_01750 [Rhodocyclaceae bacterium]|nr:hypothetical protein [Rhodocyclaceae bacterium]